MAKPINLAVAAATTLLTGVALPVSASEIQQAYYQHTRMCMRLFFSDKDAHTEQCLPNNSANIAANDGSGSPAVPPTPPAVVTPPPVVVVVAPPPPPPVVEEDDDDCDVEQTNCGPVCGYPNSV